MADEIGQVVRMTTRAVYFERSGLCGRRQYEQRLADILSLERATADEGNDGSEREPANNDDRENESAFC